MRTTPYALGEGRGHSGGCGLTASCLGEPWWGELEEGKDDGAAKEGDAEEDPGQLYLVKLTCVDWEGVGLTTVIDSYTCLRVRRKVF